MCESWSRDLLHAGAVDCLINEEEEEEGDENTVCRISIHEVERGC